MQLSGENAPHPCGYTVAIHHCVSTGSEKGTHGSKIDDHIPFIFTHFASVLLLKETEKHQQIKADSVLSLPWPV